MVIEYPKPRPRKKTSHAQSRPALQGVPKKHLKSNPKVKPVVWNYVCHIMPQLMKHNIAMPSPSLSSLKVIVPANFPSSVCSYSPPYPCPASPLYKKPSTHMLIWRHFLVDDDLNEHKVDSIATNWKMHLKPRNLVQFC